MIVHNFDPVLIDLGLFQIRWYSLAYIFGIILGWFYANKIISSGEGGLITTNDKSFYEKLKLYKNLGFTKPRFKHFIQGYNFRMTGMQAAIANSQLSYVKEIIKKSIIC